MSELEYVDLTVRLPRGLVETYGFASTLGGNVVVYEAVRKACQQFFDKGGSFDEGDFVCIEQVAPGDVISGRVVDHVNDFTDGRLSSGVVIRWSDMSSTSYPTGCVVKVVK